MTQLLTPPITLAIAGSTERTRQCTECLGSEFKIEWVLTPAPRPQGRHHSLVTNPLHVWAQEKGLPTILIENKLTPEVKAQILNLPKPQYLLVVDFGFFVPNWLLELPSAAPLNIHPSTLPNWRGSSPGQFALMYGGKTNSVTFMIMNNLLDQGPILAQIPFSVESNDTQIEYYQKAFAAMCEQLPDLLKELAGGRLTPHDQPLNSPTPPARQLTRADGFIEWTALRHLLNQTETTTFDTENSDLNSPIVMGATSQLLQGLAVHHQSWPVALEHASRGLTPWPGLWTEIPTSKGIERMSIKTMIATPRFSLHTVQFAGQQPALWNQVKNKAQL